MVAAPRVSSVKAFNWCSPVVAEEVEGVGIQTALPLDKVALDVLAWGWEEALR